MSQTIFFRFNFDDTPFQMHHVFKGSTLGSNSTIADWHFTEWTVITSVSKALKLAFDWATFPKTDHITSGVI